MDVGYSARCKVCNSEYRAEVERRKEDGSSLSALVAYLKEQGETVSKAAIHRHFVEHFPVKQETAKRYAEQSKGVMQAAVEKRLSDLEMINAVIERNYRLHTLASDSITETLTNEVPMFSRDGTPVMDTKTGEQATRKFDPSKPIVDLLTGTASEIRQAAKLKAELLGDLPPEGTLSIDLSSLTLEELRALAGLDEGPEEDSS